MTTSPTPLAAPILALAGDLLGPLINWLVGLMDVIGAPGAGVAVALENIFPPIPSEVILPLAGFTAARGRFSMFDAILWTTIGSTVGALVLYELGRRLGIERLRSLARKIPLMKVSDIDKTVAWFGRHGRRAVFFGRMVPMFRSFISIPAGVQRMPLLQFTLWTAAGSAVWNTVLVGAGYALGSQWSKVEKYTGVFQNVIIVVLVIALAWFIVHRVRQKPSPESE
ncbi:DedA family protein [Mariniluteicoccus flavus]